MRLLTLFLLAGCLAKPLESEESTAIGENDELSLTLMVTAETTTLWNGRAITFDSAPGTRFVLATIRLENLASEMPLPASPAAFELRAEGERAYAPHARSGDVPGACMSTQTLRKGADTECGIVFEVPLADVASELAYEGGTEEVVVRFEDAPKGPAPRPPAPMTSCTMGLSLACSAPCVAACASCDCLATPACAYESVLCQEAILDASRMCGCR